MGPRYASRVVLRAWAVAGWCGVGYGLFLTVTPLRSVPGEGLTGHWAAQPAFRASMALLLAVGAAADPIARERCWLMQALLITAGFFFGRAEPVADR